MARFSDPPPIANRFNRKQDWDAAREAAFDRAVLNQTLLAAALTNLLTAVQIALPNMAPAHLLRAEENAVQALSAVGGPAATPGESGSTGRDVTVHADQPYQVVSQQGGAHPGLPTTKGERQGGAGPSGAPATSQEAS